MAAIPLEVAQPTVAAIYRAHVAAAEDWRRPHLGASQLGRPCARALWYGFRWAAAPQHDGRMLRLFRRGQREEAEFVRELRAAGIEVEAVDRGTGAQFRFAVVGGHVGGSMDARLRGLPEAPQTWHVAEFKTSNAKAFAKLQKEGVEKAKPEHHAQMQCYLHWSGLTRAFYLCVNKDTDELYSERVQYDPATAEALMAKAERVVTAAEPPPRLSDDPSWFACKFCDYHAVCHGGAMAEAHCRTCAHATPELDGDARWTCARHGNHAIPLVYQKEGCPEHRWIPALVSFAEYVGGSQAENCVLYRLPDGRTFRNGAPPTGYASGEMRAPGFAALLGDALVELARRGPHHGQIVDPDTLGLGARQVVGVQANVGPQPPQPTAAGKDWGWQHARRQEASPP